MTTARPSAIYSLRPIKDADMPILREIYYASRADEMRFFPFSDEEKQQFLAMQFDAQHQHYQTYFQQAQFSCVLQNDVVIGRLYVFRGQEDMRIVDINLLPNYCNQGIGSMLLNQLLAEADDRQLRVSAHVEYNNPARRLYARLGFIEVEERGAYIFVVRPAASEKTNPEVNRTSPVEAFKESAI
ncbi:GNAT family N-acetyltransferase [Undibacterium macrobrachii]|jgi:ribosomal protein S18 acetylase RimI-like enzyme|nr:GNAT family N-acetyltransferase [Undibacterium macrobrachii]